MYSVDTNVLIYMLDSRDPAKQDTACALMDVLFYAQTRISLQVIGEVHNALTKRLGRPSWEAAQAARNFAESFPVICASKDDALQALAEAASGRFSYWDALLVATCANQKCQYLFTEDMQNGLKYGNLQLINPFAEDGALSASARSVLPKP